MTTTCAPSPYQPRAQRAMRRRHRSGFGLFGGDKRPQKADRRDRSSTNQAQTPPKTPCTNCARYRSPCLVANGVPGRGHGRLVHAKRARPEAPGGADDTSDHCRRPQLDRRESSARAAGRARKVAGAGPRKARALTAAQPEASSAALQQPRHRSREARFEAAGPHARRLCATARPSPRCAHCAAPRGARPKPNRLLPPRPAASPC